MASERTTAESQALANSWPMWGRSTGRALGHGLVGIGVHTGSEKTEKLTRTDLLGLDWIGLYKPRVGSGFMIW